MAIQRRIGPVLRRLKMASGLSYEDLGRILGKTRASVAGLCHDDANPRWITLVAFLEALGLSLADLAGEVEDPGGLRKKIEAIEKQVEELSRPRPPLALRGRKRDTDG